MATHILIVDDEANDLDHVRRAFEALGAVDLKHPQQVVPEDLAEASLVLVDYEMRHWDERFEQTTASMQPQNGVALAAIYRSFAKERFNRPMAVALYSGRLSELSKIPSETRPHVLASLTSLEWVFPKVADDSASPEDDTARLAERATWLAEAAEALPNAWPEEFDAVRAQVEELLDSPQDPDLSETCWKAVSRCHPPMFEMSSSSHGIWFLDWLLHDILPYPTFLFDRMSLAAALQLAPTGVDALIAADSAIAEQLRQAEYTGILSRFDGQRWWGPMVNALITRVRGDDRETNLGVLFAAGVGGVDVYPGDDPVVCYDAKLAKLPDLYERREAIEIRPDLWPVFARPAHAPRTLCEDAAIAALAKRAGAATIVPYVES